MLRIVSIWFLLALPLKAEEKLLLLGGTEIRVLVEEYGNGPAFVSLHDNETTSQRASRGFAARCGGRYIALKNNNKRNVSFMLDGQQYTFDPNRIFTERGIEATLRRYGPYSFAAHEEVRMLADMLSVEMVRSNPIVALHNNSNGRYSLDTYLPGGVEAVNAREVRAVQGGDRDNFFLVTDHRLFDALVARQHNAVLQVRRPLDDGSLSAFAALRGWSYVNVEAEHGQRAVQEKMLRDLAEVISCGS